MEQKIFTLKKGTEVPVRFDGATIPYSVPQTLDEMREVCGGNEQAVVQVFNEAYSLRLQKDVKSDSMEDGATLDGLRQTAANYKVGQVRSRKPAGPPKTAAAQKRAAERALLQDVLSDPETKRRYEEKLAQIRQQAAAAPAETPAAPAAEAPASPPAEAPAARGGQNRQPAGRR